MATSVTIFSLPRKVRLGVKPLLIAAPPDDNFRDVESPGAGWLLLLLKLVSINMLKKFIIIMYEKMTCFLSNEIFAYNYAY